MNDESNGRPAPPARPAKRPVAAIKARVGAKSGAPGAAAKSRNSLVETLLPIFREEARERLEAVDHNLTELTLTPAGQRRNELAEAVMRDVHSIKGGARTVGLEHLEAISRTFEAVARKLKEGEVDLSPALVDLFRSAADAIGKLVVASDGVARDHSDSLVAALAAVERGEAVPVVATPEPVAPAAPPAAAGVAAAKGPMRGVVFTVAERRFAIPTLEVARVMRAPHASLEGTETFDIGTGVVPLARLERIFELHRRERRAARPFSLVLLVGRDDRFAALVIDDVDDEREISFESEVPTRAKLIATNGRLAKMGDVSVINVGALLELVGSGAQGAPAEAAPDAVPARKILVAEDSVTSRMLLKEVLESAGYAVTTAVDGADALSVLDHRKFDLVVSDVEMPRLDGFQLTEKIRQHPTHSRVPIVLVTGRERKQDRQRGLGAGASAYVGKSTFDQDELLATIQQLL